MPHSVHKAGGEGGRRRVLTGFALVAALAGIAVLVLFVTRQQQAPQVSGSAHDTIGTPQSSGTSTSDHTTSRTKDRARTTPHDDDVTNQHAKASLGPSKPSSISVPAIDVHSGVIAIGKTPGGGLAVPHGAKIDKAAWYENSPTPGQNGPTVIEGHIDTDSGPSVFYRLAGLEPGDKIRVRREDGIVVDFTVNAVRAYPTKAAFPTKLVYGGDVSKPSLRLITCANFDHDIGHYQGNTVVYAHLTGVHHHQGDQP